MKYHYDTPVLDMQYVILNGWTIYAQDNTDWTNMAI
jgi:hypothetical protein